MKRKKSCSPHPMEKGQLVMGLKYTKGQHGSAFFSQHVTFKSNVWYSATLINQPPLLPSASESHHQRDVATPNLAALIPALPLGPNSQASTKPNLPTPPPSATPTPITNAPLTQRLELMCQTYWPPVPLVAHMQQASYHWVRFLGESFLTVMITRHWSSWDVVDPTSVWGGVRGEWWTRRPL